MSTLTNSSGTLNTLTAFKIGQPVQNTPFLQFAADTYAENFDLSLLPQDCYNSIENAIPTTVQQYISCGNQPQTPPQIKIEQTWFNSDQTTTINNEIKQEPTLSLSYEQLHLHQQQTKTSNQLIPPPAYPHQLYPSPQSSPAQSEYAFPHKREYNSCYDSLSSSRTSLYAASPCPSLDMQMCIKQENQHQQLHQHHILPPSPPESNCEAPSPHSACSDIKAEPFDAEVEAFIDLNSLFEKSQNSQKSNLPNLSANSPTAASTAATGIQQQELPQQQVQQQQQQEQQQQRQEQLQQQDHQLLREYLEDTSFQRKHNLKPLALDSFIGGLEAVRGDIEPVISLALEHAKREAEEMCAKLHISKDPCAWSTQQVHSWLRSTTQQFELPQIIDLETKFNENGAALLLLSEEEFARRAPESGSTLHAQLDVWKMAFSDNEQLQNNVDITSNESNANNNGNWVNGCMTEFKMDTGEESEDEEVTNSTITPTTSNVATSNTQINATPNTPAEPKRRTGGSHIHLWQFLKELLSAPHINGTAIRWIDRNKGIFKIEDSVRVAKLWGRRKNRPAMNYDKLSRSIRQYYKKGIMKKTERSQRLVYQFCHPYQL